LGTFGTAGAACGRRIGRIAVMRESRGFQLRSRENLHCLPARSGIQTESIEQHSRVSRDDEVNALQTFPKPS
jgi:hypothetical protein